MMIIQNIIKDRCILLPVFLGFILTFSACSEHNPDPGGVEGKAAKLYYEYLLHGNYYAYVDGFYRPDSIPDDYRSQLIDNAKMFIALQKEEHGGIKSISVEMAKADTTEKVANVFLTVTYGNKAKEQILVPMVSHDGQWMMR